MIAPSLISRLATTTAVDELLLRAVSGISSAVSLIDVQDQRLLYVNAAFERLTGYAAEEALGQAWTLCEGPETDVDVARELRDTMRRGGEARVRIRHHRRDGRPYWSETFVSPVPPERGPIRHYIAVEKDVTDRVELERRAAHLAYHDVLTGLPNRAQLQEHLSLALARSRRSETPFGLLFIDLDGFKSVNDRYGHETGDQVLEAVAQRLLAAARDGDVIARYGGDEFVVLLLDLESAAPGAAAAAAAERYAAAIRAPSTVASAPDASFSISPSVGIAVYPDHGDSGSELLMRADAAMYAAKRAVLTPAPFALPAPTGSQALL